MADNKKPELDKLKEKAVKDINKVLEKYGFIIQPYAFITSDGRTKANIRLIPGGKEPTK